MTIPSIYSVFAQIGIENSDENKIPNRQRISSLDDILTPTISATLTGLSLTGGTFLVNMTRNTSELITNNIHKARKSFIKAFFMFLICTIILFVFDFLEIVDEKKYIQYTIIDVGISYCLFALGALYLVHAAKQLYYVYGK